MHRRGLTSFGVHGCCERCGTFPARVPEDDRIDYLKAIMACARAGTELAPAEKGWVIGYGAACGAHQATIDALEQYDGDEDVVAILERNMSR